MADRLVLTAQELKTRLIRAGFEVYRARGDAVTMAERPRENLIMDSGVRITIATDGYLLRFVTRAERAVFPGEPEDAMWARARRVVAPHAERAFREIETSVRAILDPGDESHVLDTWFEVAWEKLLPDEAELLEEVAHVMRLEKAATR